VCSSESPEETDYREPKVDDVIDRMVWVTDHNLVWCPIFKVLLHNSINNYWLCKYLKCETWFRYQNNFIMIHTSMVQVASTTWVNSLLKMKGVEMSEGNTHRKARELYPLPANSTLREEFLSGAMRLIIVRHPLDRILSAYR